MTSTDDRPGTAASPLPDDVALLLVDLQVGVTQMGDVVPHSADTVMRNAARLTEAFHRADLPVIFVRVSYGPDNELQVRVPHDWNVDFSPPAGWDQLDPRLGAREADPVVVKHAYNGFYGTDLDVHLRRRGIGTLVVGGIATHGGVEATVRGAHDRGYHQIFVEDAMGAFVAEHHQHSVTQIFPLFGHVSSTEAVLARLRAA